MLSFLLTGGGRCAMPLWIPSVLIFVTRCVDVCFGCGVFCKSLAHTNKSAKRVAFGKIARMNLGVSFTQIALAVAQFSMALVAIVTEPTKCLSAGITLALAVLFLLDAGQEAVVWCACVHPRL